MGWLRSVTQVLIELFVDDGSLVLAVLLWLVLFRTATVYLAGHPLNGLFLAVALFLSLGQSVLSFAKRGGRKH